VEGDSSMKKNKRVIVGTLIGGILACVIAVIFFVVSTHLGADRPFLFRVFSIPFFIPFLLSKPFWPALWPNEFSYIYEMLAFSLIFYFISGGLVGLTYTVVNRRKFYIGLLGIASICILVPTGLYCFDLPQSPQVDQYHSIEYSGIAMPLWVRGRVDSGVIILHLHGGPGDTSIRMSMYPSYRQLESKYAVAYWDQPGAGNSRWVTPKRELSMSDSVAALDEVITFIHEHYPDSQLFLLGHSYGGEVGTKYLTEYPYLGKVSGWIEVDGAHNEVRNRELALGWLEQKATASLQEGNFDSPREEQFWKDAIEYAHTHRPFEKWNETELWDNYIEVAGGYGYSTESKPAMEGIPHYLLGRANFILERINLLNAKGVFLDALETDYTPVMKNITIPTLILWGRHDGAIGVDLALEAYESVGTDASQKEIIIFEQSGHNPMLEEPEKYFTSIEAFIDRTLYLYAGGLLSSP
jgi:proline iminopeptidase